MSSSGISQAAPMGGMEPPMDETCVVSTCRRVLTNCVSGRMLQPSIVLVIADSSVPLDFVVEVSGAGTVHPLLTLSFISTWFLPLHMKCKTSSVMDGLQKREICIHTMIYIYACIQ